MLDFTGLTKQDFIDIQNNISKQVVKYDTININNIKTVAGIDIAYWKEGEVERAVCCVVIIDATSKEVVERQHTVGEVKVHYIPGCLAFRELPLVVETMEKVNSNIDVCVFDGNGILHPRQAGLATHASILLGIPSIGVAKTYYCLDGTEYVMPTNEVGASTDLIMNGQALGRALRTHKNVKPVFVSVGNKVSIESAVDLSLRLTGKESHIPIPTRLADIDTHIYRDKYKNTNT